MNDDLISRQVAIDALEASINIINKRMQWCLENKMFTTRASYKNCKIQVLNDIETIKGLPPTQPDSHWIPVTERLPEVKQRVIVQYKDGCMEIKRCIDAGHLQWFYARTVAWMPAPEPYKGVTE